MSSSISVDANFVRVGGKSYAINKINSVEVRERKPHGAGAAYIWGLLAAPSLLIGVVAMAHDAGGGVIFLGLGALFAWLAYAAAQRAKIREYSLILMTSSGEAQAVITRDESEVQDLRTEIETAMIVSVNAF